MKLMLTTFTALLLLASCKDSNAPIEIAQSYGNVIVGFDTCTLYKIKNPNFHDMPVMSVVKCEAYNSYTTDDGGKNRNPEIMLIRQRKVDSLKQVNEQLNQIIQANNQLMQSNQ